MTSARLAGLPPYPLQDVPAGAPGGLPALRESVSAFIERCFGAAVDPWIEVLPVIGSKEAIAELAGRLERFAALEPAA